jgi:hypothetical protein
LQPSEEPFGVSKSCSLTEFPPLTSAPPRGGAFFIGPFARSKAGSFADLATRSSRRAPKCGKSRNRFREKITIPSNNRASRSGIVSTYRGRRRAEKWLVKWGDGGRKRPQCVWVRSSSPEMGIVLVEGLRRPRCLRECLLLHRRHRSLSPSVLFRAHCAPGSLHTAAICSFQNPALHTNARARGSAARRTSM